jgi:hypothetical protein
MKLLVFLLVGFGLLTTPAAFAQTTPTATTAPDTAQLRAFVGKYTAEGAPFEAVLITIENGKLMGEAVGQGKAELTPDSKTPDTFGAVGYDASVTFARDADRRVTKLTLRLNDQEFICQKAP